MLRNPIIKGFNPDPSICFADGIYYLAVSTFEYFPGVTIYASTDLVNWSYCTSVLTRTGQLDLSGCRNSGGIYAPTLRYHGNRFYMVTTNKNILGNFIVHSDSIRGEWSDPFPVSPMGIDPSLFFDDDGSCIYTSNGTVEGKKGILGATVDPDSGILLKPLRLLTVGVTGCATEAPHIYKRNGWYYLVIAEGGTEYGHHSRVLRARSLDGPFDETPSKPILSHVYRKGHPIQAVGHADLIEREDGAWFAVFLGIRPCGRANLHNLGRESFLAPVSWEDDWPVIGEDGKVELVSPCLEASAEASSPLIAEFTRPLEEYPFLKVRVPGDECYLRENGNLILAGGDPISKPLGNPVLLALRQQEFNCRFSAVLNTGDLEGRAGIAAWYNSDYHLKLQVEKVSEYSVAISLIRHLHDFEAETERIVIDPPENGIRLAIEADRDFYRFYYETELVGSASVASLCTETTMYMTFTGTLMGLWAEEGRATFLKECKLEMPDPRM